MNVSSRSLNVEYLGSLMKMLLSGGQTASLVFNSSWSWTETLSHHCCFIPSFSKGSDWSAGEPSASEQVRFPGDATW